MFGAAYLSIISGFAKSYREAQTYLGLVITIPTMPLMFAGLLGPAGQAGADVRALPEPASADDHGGARRDRSSRAFVAISVVSTLVYGAVLMWLAGRLYRREGLLG